MKHSFDFMGKLLSEELFDTEDKPYSLKDRTHKVVFSYNSYGLRTEEAQYDAKQHLLRKALYTYDSYGNKTGEEWVE